MTDELTDSPSPAADSGSTGDSGFDLVAPTGKSPESERSPLPTRPPAQSGRDLRKTAEKQRKGEWKGFEVEEQAEPAVKFKMEDIEENELDMTPMVDVTFLLLIFFMLTASFTLQKSIAQPPVPTDEPSPNVVTPEDEEEYVEIIIDQFNTYRLTSRDAEEVEAPSDQQMRLRLRDMVKRTGARKLIITAHGEATNEKVITAWDAGNDNQMQPIVIRLAEEDFQPP